MLAYLFYDSIVAIFVCLPYIFYYSKKKKEQDLKERRWELNLQFKEALNAIAGALNAGYSLESSFLEALEDMKNLYSENSPINQELKKITFGLKMNQTIEVALGEFAQRTKIEDIEAFAEVVSISKRSGGDIIKVISHTAKMISDRIEVKRQIVTLTAGKRFEVKIMSQVPIGIILYMRLFSGDLMKVMYHNIAGISIMTVLLGLYVFSYFLSIHIVEIEL